MRYSKMYSMSSDSSSFSVRNKRQHIPVWGFPFHCFLSYARGLWMSGKVSFGFSLAWFLSCKKVEPELKTRHCDHCNLDLDRMPEGHCSGCQSTDYLNGVGRGKATKRGLLGVIVDSLMRRTSTLAFVECVTHRSQGESGYL